LSDNKLVSTRLRLVGRRTAAARILCRENS